MKEVERVRPTQTQQPRRVVLDDQATAEGGSIGGSKLRRRDDLRLLHREDYSGANARFFPPPLLEASPPRIALRIP